MILWEGRCQHPPVLLQGGGLGRLKEMSPNQAHVEDFHHPKEGKAGKVGLDEDWQGEGGKGSPPRGSGRVSLVSHLRKITL